MLLLDKESRKQMRMKMISFLIGPQVLVFVPNVTSDTLLCSSNCFIIAIYAMIK